MRVAHIRTGIVLSREGGALKKMLPLFKLGLGGRFGNGKQWMSWISLDDEVAAIEHLLAQRRVAARSTSRRRARSATRSSPRTLGARAPPARRAAGAGFGPRLLLGGELADALVFGGQRVVPARCWMTATRSAPRSAVGIAPCSAASDRRGSPTGSAALRSAGGAPRRSSTHSRTRPDEQASALDELDVELDLDLVADDHTAGLERGVPLDAPILAVDRGRRR